MTSFRASFQIVEDNNCPLYELDDVFLLTDRSVCFPEGKEGCLILIRELTQLLFQLIGSSKEPDYSIKHTCSGCTGLIKFRRLRDEPGALSEIKDSQLSEKEQRLLDRISTYPLLQAVPANQLKKFINYFRGKVLRKNEILIKKGERNQNLFIILSGEVVVEDGDVPLTRLGEGEICGEMSYFGNSIATTSVRSVTESKILYIRGEDFGKLINESSAIQLFMARLLAERLSQSNAVRARDFDSCMQGRINDMAPAELLQIFHMHQKSGILNLKLPHGVARVVFCDGMIVECSCEEKRGQDAVFSILREREGLYNFTTGIRDEDRAKPPVGDFMMLLMEGVKQVDET